MKITSITSIFLLSIFSLSAQTAFMGDVTDPNFTNRFAFSQVVSTYSEQGKTPKMITYTIGENGRMTEKKEEQGKRILLFQYAYDNNWNLTEVKKQINGTLERSERYDYDTLNRVSQTVITLFEEKDSIIETNQWLEGNTRHTKRLYKGNETAVLMSFDDKNRPINEIKIDGSGYEWAYVDDLMVMRKVKGVSQSLLNIDRYDYDSENRISSMENNDLRKTYHYDNSGLLTKIHVFDSNGLLIGWEKFEYVFPNK